MRRRNLARRRSALALAALLLVTNAPVSLAQGGATRTFTSGDLSFEHPAAWAVAPAQAVEGLIGFTVKRPGLDSQITLFVSEQEIDPQLADVLRKNLFEPYVEQMAQSFEALGARTQRAPARAAFGGATADGTRLLLTAGAESGSAEFYMLFVGRRLLMVNYLQTQNDRDAAAAWELFRRTIRTGSSLAAATPATPASPAGAAAPPPAAASGPAPSAMAEGEALINKVIELSKQVMKLRAEGNYAAAEPLAEQALALAERGVPGGGFPAGFFDTLISTAAVNLAEIHRLRGDYKRAEPLLLRALAIREKAEGTAGEGLAVPLNNLAAFYFEQGDYARAEPLLLRALSIFEKAYGPEDPRVATALNNLSQFYEAKNDYARAEQLVRRSLAIYEKAHGPEHEDVALALNNLAAIREVLGDYEQAEQLLRRALAVHQKVSGPDHPKYATGLSNLAMLYKQKGDLLRAEPLYHQALAVAEKALGPDHPLVATVLDNTAQLFNSRGDAARAERLMRRALAVREKAFGPDHPDVAESLNNLALLLMERREYAESERLLSRALALLEKAHGREHGRVATAVDNLAVLYHERGDAARAEPLFRRALAVREKIFGPASTAVAVSLNNLGSLHRARGDHARAEEFYRRSLVVSEKALGPRHPSVADVLANLSSEYLALGDAARAVQTQQRANDIREHNLSLMLTTGSEGQKRLYMATLAGETDYSVFLHASAAPRDPQALGLALTAVLQRKGRVLDAMSDQMGALRRRLKPEDRAMLDELAAARARLAALVLGGPGKTPAAEYQAEVGRISSEVERLETSVGSRLTEVRAQSQPVTLEAVQRAVPEGAALVEIAIFRPYNVKSRTRDDRWLPQRYVAYVVRRGGAPDWVDLGEAAAVNQSLAELRLALADPRRADVRQLARALDERVMRPVRALLGDARQLFVSPDGALNLVPFAALVDEQDRFLVETYTLTYLTSGRDLLRMQQAVQAQPGQRQGAVVLANPAFDAGAPPTSAREHDAPAARRSADLASARFTRLPGTAAEAQAIGAIMPGVRVLTDAQATEATIKQLSRPTVLHIATHGFFLADQKKEEGARAGVVAAAGGAQPAPRGENPLLRSGLALAGANALSGGAGEDGILTAYEAAGLDLWGTRLVVLSACETGVGEVQNGDGVYGLRRALVLAGSESQVMSLWQVSDEATRDLMVEYYRRLMAGEGRSEALRRVQLEMITGRKLEAGGVAQRGIGGDVGKARPAGDRSHPFYWAAFIQSGDWKAMGTAPR